MITFPGDCNTPAKRTEYAYRVQEMLRLLHNVMGSWFKTGISKDTWDKLPLKIRSRYPFKAQLTLAEWRDFLRLFETKSNSVVDSIIQQRKLLEESATWNINIEDIF